MKKRVTKSSFFGDYMEPLRVLGSDYELRKMEEMHLREIRERAKLLLKLKYPLKKTIHRIKSNIRWEFELSKNPSFLKKVDSIVKKEYQ